MELSNSGIYYPELFSNESISQNVQPSNISLNCQESISNESFTHFTQHQTSVYNTVTTSDQRTIIYAMEPSNSYLNYLGEIYSENNSSSIQQTSSFLHEPSLKPSESISRDMQLSSIPQNYTGSISNDLNTHFQQRQNTVHNPIHNLSESISYGTEQSRSYLNYPRSMSRENNSNSKQHSSLYVNYPGPMSCENNSSSMQHSSSSLHAPVSYSNESAFRNMYMGIQEPSYNFGKVHSNKNFSFHIKNSNSSFANLESTLRGCISEDMQELSSSFNHHKAPSNDSISSQNHQTHSPLLYSEPASRKFVTNEFLNSCNSSNIPRQKTLKSTTCDMEQSNASLVQPGFSSIEIDSSDDQNHLLFPFTSGQDSSENVSHKIRNTKIVSEYPGSLYQETISPNTENRSSSSCIPLPISNKNNSYNMQQLNSSFYHPESISNEIYSRDMQPSNSTTEQNMRTELTEHHLTHTREKRYTNSDSLSGHNLDNKTSVVFYRLLGRSAEKLYKDFT
ncbi:hypothetical protein NPIL_546971 [Nephila pilipes]|uniref:Uncharacterized protein n=1 Tax=Nephila pilipes TaxID=299642 RepID=A0A8X6TDI8_NEPPI|nr:hypothetical protein NPIL_546971 [Nephila pilipes]